MNAIQTEVERLNLASAEAFFAVTIHRDASGQVVPTITIVAEGAEATSETRAEMHAHLSAIAKTLRKGYAPK